ncbi:ABC transporter ATP-binding protein, partial [Streptomyces sp. NPDC056004]
MTSTGTGKQQLTTASPPPPQLPPPPPAEFSYSGQYAVNPLAEVSFRKMCGQIPTVLHRIARLSWRTDRNAVRLLIG